MLSYLNAIELYKLILSGDIKKFPSGFWLQPNALENSATIVKYLLEEKLKWNEQQIKKNISYNLFRKYKLGGMLESLFDKKLFPAVDNAYPNKFNPWELVRVTPNYWNEERGKEVIRWLVINKLNLNETNILKELKFQDFVDNGLQTPFRNYYGASIINVATDIFPSIEKPTYIKTLVKRDKAYYDEITKQILELKDNENKTFAQIGELLKISRQRVHQIYKKATK